MEYTLYSIFYFIQSLFNLLMNLEVVPGVSVGGILVSVFVFSVIFGCLGLFSSGSSKKESRDPSK